MAQSKKVKTLTFDQLCASNKPVDILGPPQSVSVKERPDCASDENTFVHTRTGTIRFADPDAGDTHKATVTSLGSGFLGNFELGSVNQSSNKVGWSFSVSDGLLDSLQEGQTILQNYKVTVNDGHGHKDSIVVTVKIAGTNDVPVVICTNDEVEEDFSRSSQSEGEGDDDDEGDDEGDDHEGGGHCGEGKCYQSGSVIEDQNVDQSTNTLSGNGSFKFDDADLLDTHLISVVSNAGNLGTLTATLTDPATGVGDGTIVWTYTVNNDLVQYLDDSDHKTEQFSIRIDDQHGGVVFQPVTVTIYGAEDEIIS